MNLRSDFKDFKMQKLMDIEGFFDGMALIVHEKQSFENRLNIIDKIAQNNNKNDWNPGQVMSN